MKKISKKLNLNKVTVSTIQINGGNQALEADANVSMMTYGCAPTWKCATRDFTCNSFTGSYVACPTWAC